MIVTRFVVRVVGWGQKYQPEKEGISRLNFLPLTRVGKGGYIRECNTSMPHASRWGRGGSETKEILLATVTIWK